jgi:outer membrane protein OmpA-like peptidoglycan-associated protein
MKRILFCMVAAVLMMPAHAQFFDRLVNSARNSAENAVERQVEKKIEEGIDKAFNPEIQQQEQEQRAQPQETIQPQSGWTCPACGHKGNTGKFCNECGAKKPEGNGTWTCPACGHKGNTGKFCNECGAKKPEAGNAAPAPKKSVESVYAKSDFVPGDEIMFEDDLVGEQMGEFPSKWDLLEGNAEIAAVNGQTVINLTDVSTEITPLMKTPKNYLTEAFTLEFDFLGGSDEKSIYCDYIIHLKNIEGEDVATINLNGTASGWAYTSWVTASGEQRENRSAAPAKDEEWNHVALSFNKRALKVYLNGSRIVNVPNCARPQYFTLQRSYWADHRNLMTNVRLCKGAVPLYNRLVTDGKIITYAITFDIGKANIKPESMTEINRIAQLMKDNADLKFEVQGHTDNTGTVAGNQKLSEQRAQAIVNKLVEMGIAANRLSAKGMGQSAPLADNSTDEGRAKNRRVEFVKK